MSPCYILFIMSFFFFHLFLSRNLPVNSLKLPMLWYSKKFFPVSKWGLYFSISGPFSIFHLLRNYQEWFWNGTQYLECNLPGLGDEDSSRAANCWYPISSWISGIDFPLGIITPSFSKWGTLYRSHRQKTGGDRLCHLLFLLLQMLLFSWCYQNFQVVEKSYMMFLLRRIILLASFLKALALYTRPC